VTVIFLVTRTIEGRFYWGKNELFFQKSAEGTGSLGNGQLCKQLSEGESKRFSVRLGPAEGLANFFIFARGLFQI